MSPVLRLARGWITLFVIGTDLFIVSPLLPALSREFDLSPAKAGLCVTAFSLVYLLSAPFFGRLADRRGRRRVLPPCLLVFALGNLLTGLASGFGWLLAARVVTGIAASGVSPLIYAGVGEAAPPARRATWMAIAVSGLLLSLSAGAPAGALIASVWGWRSAFLLLTVLSLVLAAANRTVWPAAGASPDAGVEAPPVLVWTAVLIALTPTVLWATALYGAYTYAGTWLAGAGLTPSGVADSISCYGLGALAGTLLGGQASDRLGPRITRVLSITGLVAGLLLFARGVPVGLVTNGVLAVTSLCAQLFFPAHQASLVRWFPGHRGFMLAMNNSALFLGISLGSLTGGQAMAAGGFRAVGLTGAAIGCLALVCVAMHREPDGV